MIVCVGPTLSSEITFHLYFCKKKTKNKKTASVSVSSIRKLTTITASN